MPGGIYKAQLPIDPPLLSYAVKATNPAPEVCKLLGKFKDVLYVGAIPTSVINIVECSYDYL
jgi:hypothetical protein